MSENQKRYDALKEYHEKVKSGEIEKPVVLDPIEKAKANPKNCTAKDCPLWNVRPWQ
jgi:hypothetical protein